MNSAFSVLKVPVLLGAILLFAGSDLQTTTAEEELAPEKIAAADAAATATNQVATAERLIAAPVVEKKLSAPLQELLKMAERGLGDDVLVAWVKNSPTPFILAPDDIVYLTDLGISEAVVKALIEHRGNGTAVTNPPAEAAPAPPPINPPVRQPASNQPAFAPNAAPAATIAATPEFETAPQNPQPQSQVTYVEQPAPVQNNYFYSSLAPYGSWIEVPDYGLCWRPTVAVIDPGWRPYSHRGRWLYTNCGWYWQSDYSWGWAPFHYGRWWNHPRAGWVWAADSAWSPAWVTWRYSDAYCGWAPLPPGSGYRSGIGLTYRSAGISLGFDFGLGRDCFTFVPARHFHDRAPWRYALAPHQVVNVYNHTTVINNISHNANNTLVNEGPGRDRIARITRSEIPKVNIRDVPADGPRIIKSDRLERGGKELAVYRPLNPTLPPEGSNGSMARHEIAKTPMAMSPRASAEMSKSPVRTIGSNRTAASPTPSATSKSSSASSPAGASGRTDTLTEASLSKSAVEDRESRFLPGRRSLDNPVPVVRAPNPATATPQTRESAPIPSVNGKASIEQRNGTISTQPQRTHTPINPTPASATRSIRSTPLEATSPQSRPAQSITPPLNYQRPLSVSRGTINSPAPTASPNSQASYEAPATRPAPATATPAYRQEVTKPIIVNSPQPQSYSAPNPVTRVAPQNAPYSSPGPASVPQATRASPVYSAPRPQQSAPAPSAARAGPSQSSTGGNSDRRTDRSNTR